jgi:hypothetical protein
MEVSLVKYCLMKRLDYSHERFCAIHGGIPEHLDASGKWRIRVPAREIEVGQ